MSGRNECRIYVGNLPPDIRTKDIQDLFYKFGKVTFVDLKNRRGPPFAFVEFEDARYFNCLHIRSCSPNKIIFHQTVQTLQHILDCSCIMNWEWALLYEYKMYFCRYSNSLELVFISVRY